MNFHPIPDPVLKDLYEIAQDAEYDSATGLCLYCGEATGPLHNHPHTTNCKWLQTILTVEALLAKEN